ncbi:uncharacterized protein LOC116175885 [Photinus pyralis]|uniref:uncharacterized protein LOC116175885 n=1 Tax=Photinus pyralis TaxID=7054 RepID=UPI0012670778|nr:uncharacterized protein LOC116175885 [Photinus pyralis]
MEEISQIASAAKKTLLPCKSRTVYEEAYNAYKKWCVKRNVKKTVEDTILAYFTTDLASYKASSLWSKNSMLRTTIHLNEGVDISKFPSVIPFLKRKGEGYTPKKSLILTDENVDSFLLSAQDEHHLLNKVILIFGVAGACRRQELVFLQTTNVEDQEKHFLVKMGIIDTKTKKDRSFVILPGKHNLLHIIRKYIAIRPKVTSHNRFFINYQNGKCTVQPVGVHKVGGVPSVVAKFLNLTNASSYTGHSFRRTSASLLANAGGSMTDIMRHGGWRSASVAEGYVEESEMTKVNVATKILGGAGPSSHRKEIEERHQMSGQLFIKNNVDCVININNYYANKHSPK